MTPLDIILDQLRHAGLVGDAVEFQLIYDDYPIDWPLAKAAWYEGVKERCQANRTHPASALASL